jgi:FkbM family methyltransferase
MRRRLNAIPALRRVLTWRPVERLVALLNRSRVVEGARGRFLAREVLARGSVASYRVTGAGTPVLLRHGTPDVVTLDEVFLARDYDLPGPVSQALAGLDRGPRVVDLGANAGYFGAFVLGRFPDAELVAVEPDPDNAELLRRAVAASGRAERWRVVEACAATREGTVRFLAGRHSLSRLAGEDEPGIEVAAVDAFEHLEGADLAKVDIEGAEWPLLADPRLGRGSLRAIVVEYHPAGCPEPEPGPAARRLLADAGFEVLDGSQRGDGYGVVWGWKPS